MKEFDQQTAKQTAAAILAVIPEKDYSEVTIQLHNLRIWAKRECTDKWIKKLVTEFKIQAAAKYNVEFCQKDKSYLYFGVSAHHCELLPTEVADVMELGAYQDVQDFVSEFRPSIHCSISVQSPPEIPLCVLNLQRATPVSVSQAEKTPLLEKALGLSPGFLTDTSDLHCKNALGFFNDTPTPNEDGAVEYLISSIKDFDRAVQEIQSTRVITSGTAKLFAELYGKVSSHREAYINLLSVSGIKNKDIGKVFGLTEEQVVDILQV